MGTLCAILLLLAAILFSCRARFVQFRQFGRALRQPFLAAPGRRDAVSPLQAAATSLAATIGTGNIAGVAGAILLGGPGAIVWLLVSGALGMGLKYAEVLIAMRYRRRGGDGQWRGGPMYCILLGLPRRWSFLATAFALCGALVALGMGDLVQVNVLAESAQALCLALTGPVGERTLLLVRLFAGLLTAGLLLAVLSGGALRIGRAAALLVPLMSAVYLLFCLVILTVNADALPAALLLMLESAFAPRAALGGAAGFGFLTVLRVGLSRGVFTHEAGLGTAAIAHSGADGADPHAQALYGVFEVFFDVLICLMTALTVLVSGVALEYGNAEINSTLVIDAFATRFGPTPAAAFLAVSLLLFAFTSMTSFALYGARCAEFLFGGCVVKPYYALFLLIAVTGALLPRSAAWEIAEWLNAAMAIPNLAAMLLLTRKNRALAMALRR